MRKKISNIFKIYKADMKNIRTNWVAFIIIGGLACLPSLYAWVNIKASWDPYSNTKGVKVGVVNKDKGATFKGADIDIGSGVVDNLKNNTKLGWTFYSSEEDGKDAVEKGKVYATIIIPEDFSYKMSTALDAKPVKPKLEYFVNDKVNAIAPKMTDNGATTLQNQISQTFIDTSIKKVFEAFNKAGIEMNDYYPQIEKYKVALFELNDRFPEASKKLDKIIEGANDGLVELDNKNENIKDVQKILESTVGFLDDINKNLGDASKNLDSDSTQLKQDLSSVQSILSDVSKTTGDLQSTVNVKKPEVLNSIDDAIDGISDLQKDLDTLGNRIEKTGVDTSGKIKDLSKQISSAISEDKDLLVKLKSTIKSTQSDIEPILDNLKNATDKLTKLVDQLITEVPKALDKIETKLSEVSSSASDLNAAATPENIKEKAGDVVKQVDKTADNLDKAASEASSLKDAAKLKKQAGYLRIISKELTAMTNNMPQENYEKMSEQIKELSSQIEKLSDGLLSDIKTQQPNIEKLLSDLQKSSDSVSRFCRNLQTTLSTSAEEAISKIDSTIDRLNKANDEITKTLDNLSKSTLEDSNNVAYDIRKVVPKLQDLKSKLSEARNKVSSHDDLEKLLKEVNELTTSLASSTQRILIRLDSDILPTVERYLKNASLFVLDIRNVVSSTNKDLDMFRDFLTRINNKGKISVGELNEIKAKLPKIEKALNEITSKIKEFEKTASLQDVINVFQNDAKTEGNFFAHPVDLSTHRLFAMGAYGAAMTPFYSTLSLWVGALLLTALLSTKAKNVDFKFTPKEEFFGKYLLFGTLAVIQGFIVCLGDLVVLGVTPQQPVLLVVLGMFYSMVFTMIVYSLVSLFGNVGKAIGVVFMVIQLAGSGGTFPIEVTPKFFQMVYASLPFTYAISGMREAIGGVVYSILIKDISVLIAYFVGFMVMGLTLKKWVNKILHHLNHKLGESGLVDH